MLSDNYMFSLHHSTWPVNYEKNLSSNIDCLGEVYSQGHYRIYTGHGNLLKFSNNCLSNIISEVKEKNSCCAVYNSLFDSTIFYKSPGYLEDTYFCMYASPHTFDIKNKCSIDDFDNSDFVFISPLKADKIYHISSSGIVTF